MLRVEKSVSTSLMLPCVVMLLLVTGAIVDNASLDPLHMCKSRSFALPSGNLTLIGFVDKTFKN